SAIELVERGVELLESRPGQLEGGQALREELRSPPRDGGAALRGRSLADVGGQLLVPGRQLEHAHTAGDGLAAELIGREEAGFTPVLAVPDERSPVACLQIDGRGRDGNRLFRRSSPVAPGDGGGGGASTESDLGRADAGQHASGRRDGGHGSHFRTVTVVP